MRGSTACSTSTARSHDLDRPLSAPTSITRSTPGSGRCGSIAARRPRQLAVLLHDIERLASEPDARVEHLAADYQAFKDAHARAGAQLARAVLLRAGVAHASPTRRRR